MLEEESAKNFLDVLLPKILPSGITSLCVPHRGKDDLQKSIPRKLTTWLVPNTFFVILHDQDNHDCVILKNELQRLCDPSSNQHTPLIRIICRELEAWYCGDLDAVQKAFPGFIAARYKNKSRFQNPDNIVKPSNELKKIVKEFSKNRAAREVPQHMDIDNNTSVSFNHMITGVRDFVATHLNARKN